MGHMLKSEDNFLEFFLFFHLYAEFNGLSNLYAKYFTHEHFSFTLLYLSWESFMSMREIANQRFEITF